MSKNVFYDDVSKLCIEIQRNQSKGTIKTQNPKSKTIARNKETQMTEQHEPLWKPEAKSGAPEGVSISWPVMMSPMSY